MKNEEAKTNLEKLLLLYDDDDAGIIDFSIIRESIKVAIEALKAQDSKTRKNCDTCKHDPPSKKWPCVDCDMREPADRWERQDITDTNVGDMISRQAVLDILYLDPGIDEIREKMIKKLPSAQPEIIRCKDCKYWQDQEEGVVEVPICARPANKYEKFPLVMLIGGDGFCSYAERRTD